MLLFVYCLTFEIMDVKRSGKTNIFSSYPYKIKYTQQNQKKKTKNKSFKNGDSCIESPKYFR